MVFDFHTHTFLSDGDLAPVELIRRAVVQGYRVIAVTDHVGPGNVEWVVRQLAQDCAFCQAHWDILALPGVEITHVPPETIPDLAQAARAAGARLIVVHGETPVEPVVPGTNLAAVRCRAVDILAHPGLLTPDEAHYAAENGVFLELSARRGHCLANGHIVQVARAAGALLLVDSDGHAPGDLLSADFAQRVARGAGLTPAEAATVLTENPQRLLARLGLTL